MGAATATPYASVGAYCADGPAAIRGAVGWPGMGEHHDFDLGGSLLDGGSAVDWGDLPIGDDFAANRATIETHIRAVLAEQRHQKAQGLQDIERLSVISEHSSQSTKERAWRLAHGYWQVLKE